MEVRLSVGRMVLSQTQQVIGEVLAFLRREDSLPDCIHGTTSITERCKQLTGCSDRHRRGPRRRHRLDAVGCSARATTCSSRPTPARDWRANFYPVGIAHSIVGGTAWEPTPWRAVQRAAWETLSKNC